MLSKIKNGLSLTFVSIIVGFSSAAQAVIYPFDDYVGNVYVSEWAVESGNGTKLFIKVNMPTCPATSQLEGYINLDYHSTDGGYLQNYTINAYGYEGYQGWLSVNSNYNMSETGTLTVRDYTSCGLLDVTSPNDWNVGQIELDATKWFDW